MTCALHTMYGNNSTTLFPPQRDILTFALQEFQRKQRQLPDIVAHGHNPRFDGSGEAEHGTAVAGCAIGASIGFAPEANWKFAAEGDDGESGQFRGWSVREVLALVEPGRVLLHR